MDKGPSYMITCPLDLTRNSLHGQVPCGLVLREAIFLFRFPIRINDLELIFILGNISIPFTITPFLSSCPAPKSLGSLDL